MIDFGFIIITCIITYTVGHGNDGGGPNLLFIYTDKLTENLKTVMLNKVNVSLNISTTDNVTNTLKYIIRGCDRNFIRDNCTNSCLPIWTLLHKQKLKSAIIGLPYELIIDFKWPSMFYDKDVLNLGLTVILKRVVELIDDEKISLVMMSTYGNISKYEWSQLSVLLQHNIVNVVVVVVPPLSKFKSQVFIAGPSFVTSKQSQGSLRPMDLYLLITKVLKFKDYSFCSDGDQFIVSKFINMHPEDNHWWTIILVVSIISASLTMILVMIIMSIRGVCARKLKSNRFNLGARIDNTKKDKQVERNYLLDSSDDEELFSGTIRDPRLPTLLKIDDNLSDIALH